MNIDKINRILQETAYIRTGGSAQELACANYLKAECEKLGFSAHLEAFEVPMASMKTAKLIVDGKEIPCKGYLCAGCGEIEAPLLYMPEPTPYALSQCRGKSSCSTAIWATGSIRTFWPMAPWASSPTTATPTMPTRISTSASCAPM